MADEINQAIQEVGPPQIELATPGRLSDGAASETDAQFQARMQQLEQQRQQQPQQSQAPVSEPQTPAEPTIDLNQGLDEAELAREVEQAIGEVPDSPTEAQEEATQPQSNIDFEEFSTAFRAKFGVDLEDAVQSVNSIKQQSEQLQQLTQTVNARMQQLELMAQWGVSSSDVTDRLNGLLPVYQALSEPYKQHIRSKGTKGLMELYDLVAQRNATGSQQQPSPVPGRPGGTATIAGDASKPEITPELIAIENDRDFVQRLGEMFPQAK